MGLSSRTKSSIASVLITPEDDYYPDRDLVTGEITSGTAIPRLPRGVVPTTSNDVSKAFKWKHGDTLRGTFAQAMSGLKAYRKDIDDAYGNEDDYRDIYIDTTKPLMDQFKKWGVK